MTTSSNITLNVGNQGLSYAIDKELDKQLGQNVALNYNEWMSVFDTIKQNQVTTNKSQFSENDTDIKNGQQFVVQQNEEYAINSTVWSKIVDIAKKSLGITEEKTTAGQETEVTAETPETASPDTETKTDPEEKVKELLKNSGIDFTGLTEEAQKDVLSKYNTMLAVAEGYGETLDDETLQTRLANYVQGKKYTNFTESVLLNPEQQTTFDEHCKNGFKDLDEMKTAYKSWGDAIVEAYDQDGLKDSSDGDLNLNFQEMLYSELTKRYKMTGDDDTTAKQKALKTVEKYKDLDLAQIQNWQLDNSAEAETVTEVALRFATLDQNGDYRVSTDEAGAFMLATAQAQDDKNAVTSDEVLAVESTIGSDNDQRLNDNIKTYYDFLTQQ